MNNETYYIPANFTDTGRVMGMFELRNLVEAVILTLPVLYFCLVLLPFAMTISTILNVFEETNQSVKWTFGKSHNFEAKSRHASKRGSPHLRKVLFQDMSVVLQHAAFDNPVYCFMDKKRTEGKHFYVYMVAGAGRSGHHPRLC